MTPTPAPNVDPDRSWGRDDPSSLVNRIRERDVRIPYVERAFLARQLGLGRDDLDLLPDAAVEALLNSPTSVMNVIGAERLLERLDAAVYRDHALEMEYHGPITTATIPIGEDESFRLVLEDGTIHLPSDVDPASLWFTIDDADALAYALLRLVDYARTDRYTNQVIGTDNGPQSEEPT